VNALLKAAGRAETAGTTLNTEATGGVSLFAITVIRSIRKTPKKTNPTRDRIPLNILARSSTTVEIPWRGHTT